MTSTKRVLFVCTGNTCRSPIAEALFRKSIEGREDISVQSAGVAASDGSPCSRATKKICSTSGAPLEGFLSKSVSPKLLKEATHVFAMTRDHIDALENRFPEYSGKYYLVCEFADIPGVGIGDDVPDPIGMGMGAYEEVGKVLGIAIPAIIAYIDQTATAD